MMSLLKICCFIFLISLLAPARAQGSAVSFTSPAATLSSPFAGRALRTADLGGATIRYLCQEGQLEDMSLNLLCRQTEVLVCPRNEMELEFRPWCVSVKPKAIILLSGAADVVKLQVLFEQSASAVSVGGAGEDFVLRGGEEIVVAANESALVRHLDSDAVKRTDIVVARSTDGSVLARGKFQIVSLLKHAELLRHLRYSSLASEREVFWRSLKMAACLHYLGCDNSFERMMTTQRCFNAPHLKVR